VRLGVIAVYALATGSWIDGGRALLHALPGHSVQLTLLGALLVFSAGAFSMALQVVAGTIGIGITILVFVVLGNPSAVAPIPGSCFPPSGGRSARGSPPAPGRPQPGGSPISAVWPSLPTSW